MSVPAQNIPEDPPLDERVLQSHLQRLGMRLWRHPNKPGRGVIFCKTCGHRGDDILVLARWSADPLGCFRMGDTSCDGRPFL